MPARIPDATYRLQFNRDFTFVHATALVEYLHALGISDVYASPLLKARPGSVHGYDVVDHTTLNPEIGTEEQFDEFARRLRRHDMGLLMDIVPNHMCIAGSYNRWWLDVLENGPSSHYARFFDIDWQPPNPNLTDKLMLPFLGDQYGRVLENQELKVSYRGGAFFINYYETALPLAPRTYTHILELMLTTLHARLGEAHLDTAEVESIRTALRNLPPRTETDPERSRERRRETIVAKRRLATLVKDSGEVRRALHEALVTLNGSKGQPESFDRLEQLLAQQAYRLSYWRVAADEINYRRFFDINELAAVRVEERPVFTAVHQIIFRLLKQGAVTGLRIDHVDGLFNPEKYLYDLQRECRELHAAFTPAAPSVAAAPAQAAARQRELPFYVVVEKILGHDEQLRREWPVQGTTGYDFMNLLNGVFVDTTNAAGFRALYNEFTGAAVNYSDLLYECKQLILRVAMSSELHVLARRLDRISEQHRWSRDFTFNSLHDALAATIACFPVYRSYVRRQHTSVHPSDRANIQTAIRAAKRRNPAVSASIYDFIGSLLLLADPKGLSSEQRGERRDFVMRFQQLTSPVTAKGLEDTAFYRFYPLASLNEVGGEPAVFGVTCENFQQRLVARSHAWPHALSATSTHDTKRSEDVRARINALSEQPDAWRAALARWRDMNQQHKREVEGVAAPDANEEYLLYQTLVGTWPLAPMNEAELQGYIERIQAYMNKALKEAKVHSSWINPDETYDEAVRAFVQAILAPGATNRFRADFETFQQTTTRAGMCNSLAQTLLKIVVPGVPDFYQGSELWDFSLVDPDNRRPVDYEHRQALLAALAAAEQAAGQAALVAELAGAPADGRIKLYVTSRALTCRRAHAEVFAHGAYVPLAASGQHARHVVACKRQLGAEAVVAVVARFTTQLDAAGSDQLPTGAAVWGDTMLNLDASDAGTHYVDAFTGREFAPTTLAGTPALALADVCAQLPVALLVRRAATSA